MRLSPVMAFVAFVSAITARAQFLQTDVSFPYAFHGWNTVGVSADVGDFFAAHHFIGIEGTDFSFTTTNTYPVIGPLSVHQRVEALQLVYRFYLSLVPASGQETYSLLDAYAGVGAGIGNVRQGLPNTPAVTSAVGSTLSADNTEWAGEVAAGLQFNLGPHFGIKAGLRYLDSFNNVRQFNADTNTDTKALELGGVIRF